MIVTGLANAAPVLPGNAGVYQGAAIGALAMAGVSGSHAAAASLVARSTPPPEQPSLPRSALLSTAPA